VTDIQTGFTGPETEALSIIFENVNKAEGGIVSLYNGGDISDADFGGFSDYSSVDAPSDSSEAMSAGLDEEDDEDSARGGDYMTDDSGEFTGYGAGYEKSIEDAVSRNPQLSGFLGKQIQDIISKGKARDFEFDKKGQLTGVYSERGLPGTLSVLSGLLGGPTTGRVYTGYGKGAELTQSNDSEEPSQMIKKIVEEQKEEDIPLTEAELDYYTRGMGTATKPLKSLKDVNEYMSTLVGKTESPTGAKLSKDKKFLILPNGKIINLRTGKVQESMSGLELFRGGLI
jgi:exonuclease VII small subunit